MILETMKHIPQDREDWETYFILEIAILEDCCAAYIKKASRDAFEQTLEESAAEAKRIHDCYLQALLALVDYYREGILTYEL